jgi:hypothetical protein
VLLSLLFLPFRSCFARHAGLRAHCEQSVLLNTDLGLSLNIVCSVCVEPLYGEADQCNVMHVV